MFIQLQPQYLSILKLKLEFLAIEHRIVLVDDTMVVGTDDNNVRRIIVLRTGEVVDVMGLDNTITILVTYPLTANLVAIIVKTLQSQDDAAVYLTILYQSFLFFNRSRLVVHKELVIITLLVDFLWHYT